MAPIDITALIQQCAPNVAPSTLERILHIESTYRPYVIGYKISKQGSTYTLTRQPQNKKEAISWARYLYANGYTFDAGLAGVRSIHFERFGLTPETVFEPCTNIRTGGVILTEFYTRAARQYGEGQRAILQAISAYGTGSTTKGYGYVAKFTNAPEYLVRRAMSDPAPVDEKSVADLPH